MSSSEDLITDINNIISNQTDIFYDSNLIEYNDFLPTKDPVPSIENIYNLKRIENLETNYSFEFLRLLQLVDFEYGHLNEVDYFLRDQFNINVLATRAWIEKIYVNNFYNTSVIIGLLRAISRVDSNKIGDTGILIASTLLLKNDINIREAALNAIESWGTEAGLKILKGIDAGIIETFPNWLKNYYHLVINDLEEQCQS